MKHWVLTFSLPTVNEAIDVWDVCRSAENLEEIRDTIQIQNHGAFLLHPKMSRQDAEKSMDRLKPWIYTETAETLRLSPQRRTREQVLAELSARCKLQLAETRFISPEGTSWRYEIAPGALFRYGRVFLINDYKTGRVLVVEGGDVFECFGD
jgi:hypothetical protein